MQLPYIMLSYMYLAWITAAAGAYKHCCCMCYTLCLTIPEHSGGDLPSGTSCCQLPHPTRCRCFLWSLKQALMHREPRQYPEHHLCGPCWQATLPHSSFITAFAFASACATHRAAQPCYLRLALVLQPGSLSSEPKTFCGPEDGFQRYISPPTPAEANI